MPSAICEATQRYSEPEEDGLRRLPQDQVRVHVLRHFKDDPANQLAVLQRLSTLVGKLYLAPQEGSEFILVRKGLGDLLLLLSEVDRQVLRSILIAEIQGALVKGEEHNDRPHIHHFNLKSGQLPILLGRTDYVVALSVRELDLCYPVQIGHT